MPINVIDSVGATQSINTLPNPGIATVASGLPIVEVSDSASGSISIANANYATPTVLTPTTNSAVEVTTSGYNNLIIQVSGTFTGTLQVQGTVDGTNWITLGSSRLHTYVGTVTTSITAAGIYMADVAGLYKTRVTSTTAAVTGAAAVYFALTSNVGIPAVLGGVTTVSTVSIVSSVTAANLSIPGIIADAASGAITTTATTATISPTFGCSYEVNIPVTVVSGTNPTLDVVIQESDNTGTNWFDVYHFERITATGIYRSPKLPLTGNRIRYVQTVGGTSPSFTRSINRLQSSDRATPFNRFFDRTLNSAQAINAVTQSFSVINTSSNAQLIVDANAITTAPVFRLQGSEDGIDWYNLSATTLTAVANSAVQMTITGVPTTFVRAIVTTAGVSAALNYICIKVF